MRLLFIATLAKTLHELTVGTDLADQLSTVGIESHFVVDAGNEDAIRSAGYPYSLVHDGMGPRVRETVAAVVRRVAPRAIILSDYLGHWLQHRLNYETDPWYVCDLGPPVVPIDLYDLPRTGRRVEVLGRVVDIDRHDEDMPTRLLPVPVNRPQTPYKRAGQFVLPYRANGDIVPSTAAERFEVRRSLGAAPEERLLMFPTLPWQHAMRTRAGPATRELAERVPRLFGHYLRRLPQQTRFVMTGPYLEGLGLPSERCHVEPAPTVARYHQILGAVDGISSVFLTSYALERAILADVPGVLTVNSVRADGPEDVMALKGRLGGPTSAVHSWLNSFPGPVPPFYAWPLRWTAFLRGMLRDNPFTETVLLTELLDEEAVVGGLEAVLYDIGTRERLAEMRARYRDAMGGLPPVAEAFLSAIETGV
ncbi:hypothetical protein GCM10023347_22130 [Streptomyces chumphonensis]|uniref:DUF6365 family protein n=1 Tax=Streptomyces chumphonensis TaxID=1214925 RepID=UPI001CD0E7F9|nr:DUF6365 family protein [Streptomyces chumphonensis]